MPRAIKWDVCTIVFRMFGAVHYRFYFSSTLSRLVFRSHFETYLSLSTEGWDDNPVPAYVEREFRRYLECGILAHGFARARCPECGHDFLVAFSCKGRGVCPSCNARRMAETAAHLVGHVFPPLPVRQWVLSLPKRLRYFLRQDRKAVTAVLTIFLRVVEQALREQAPVDGEKARLGAVSFVHRFGSALNEHVHFHCCGATRGRTRVYQGIEDPVFCHRYPTGACVGGNPGVRSLRDTVASA